MRASKRIGYSIVPLLFLVLSTEAVLRYSFMTLPSLDALKNYTKAPSFAKGSPGCNLRLEKQRTWGSGGILYLGDSISDGFGVVKEDRFTTHLAEAFPARRTEVLARPGADTCMEISMLDQRLPQPQPPSLVVWEVMADDLMGYMLYSFEGQPAAIPSAEPNPVLRVGAENSYFFNLLWWHLRRHSDGGGRIVSPEQRAQLVSYLRDLKQLGDRSNIRLLPYLLEPAGWEHCGPDPRPSQPCYWMRLDLDHLANIFTEAGLPPVDLRGLWKGHPPLVIPREMNPGMGGVGIHPNAEGHLLIAKALQPHIQAALEQMDRKAEPRQVRQ